MSLRYQIILRILLSALCVLLLGGAMAIWQARQAVKKEVDASIHLALQLITLGMAQTPSLQAVDDLSRLSTLRQTRHLSIELQKPDGQSWHFVGQAAPEQSEKAPPAWFVRWVTSDYPQMTHQITTESGDTLTLVIQPQPLDEINEVWQESLGFFSSLALLTLLTFLLVNWGLNKSLKSIDVIVNALGLIETGQYQQQLPTFSTQEFDTIAKAVNHMTVELEKTRQENRALTVHSLAIQEEERRRLSQELHDELGQSLTAIKVMAVTAAQPKADTLKITGMISDICDHLMHVVRTMMQQLHPLVLTELGLKATLEELVNHWAERNPDLQLHIDCCSAVDHLDQHMACQLYRVIQECLTNVVRHAQARQVWISLQLMADERRLCLQVKDDGRGCDLAAISRGFGLRGVQERIKSLNGEVSMQSTSGAGMQIKAWVPLL